MVRWLSRFFNYLDRYYIQRHNLHSLKDVGLIVFRDNVYVDIKRKAKEALLRLVQAEREGEQVDRSLIKNVLAIYQEVGMGSVEHYEKDFEAPLLQDTADYYRRCAAAWITEDSTPDYLVKSEECLKAEEARVDAYLHSSTRPKLLQKAEEQLLKEHQSELLEKEGSGCAALLQDDKKSDLSRMYRMFRRIPRGLDPMGEIFKKHVEDEGMKLVRDTAEAMKSRKDKEKEAGKVARDSGGSSPEHTFIRSLVALHDKYYEYVVECFENASLFHKALKEAFEVFCNKTVATASVSELMASFCDNLLRKGGGERLSDEDLDAVLDKVIKLLAYVSDKDLFSEFYRKKLSRRLISGLSASEDAEKAVLTRLKQQCGAQFTSKMEGMVNDLAIAKEKETAFQEWLNIRNTKLPIDMSVTVLTTGFWPTFKQIEMSLPQEMMVGLEAFNKFHDESQNKTRKLTWQFSMGTVHLKATFDKVYELIVAPIHVSVLQQFNDCTQLSYADIRDKTKLAEEDLDRALASLTLLKYKILNKSPAGRSIGKQDVFSINIKFTDRARRVRISLPPIDDRRKVQEDVDKDRQISIEAGIVRIMKSRKVLQHQQLVMEVVQQLSKMFNPDMKVIKRSIERLIDREYLERDANNTQLYKYLA